MPMPSIAVALPTADRSRAHAFYRDALDLLVVGELADDGVPEPLQFRLNDGVQLMLIPTDGFGWVIAPCKVATEGHNECLLGLGRNTAAAVDELVAKATVAGALIVSAPAARAWGYSAVLADPDGHLWQITSDPSGTGADAS